MNIKGCNCHEKDKSGWPIIKIQAKAQGQVLSN